MAENDLQKLAVDIEGMKKDIANASMFHSRLDTAIDKLTDVSTSIKQMLAVHEQKLTQTEKTEEILFDKVRERGEELDMVYRDLQRDISQVEKRLLLEMKTLRACFDGRVSVLERWRWLIIGGALAIGFIVAKNMPKIINSAGWF
jgi:hypothetical protein|tara:strand:+ start:1381 stop:1815 length:435 start_codon:yes stop_codon:yes gene_type:complete